MFRKIFSFGGPLLVAGALVLVTPGSGQAQRHGGGGFHHGGFRGGGFHGGGFHGSGFNRGFHHGGFHHGGFNRGFHHGGFHHGGLWWYPRYYGYYPYYGYSNYYPYYSYSNYFPYAYSSDWSGPAYDSGYYGAYGNVTESYLGSDLSVTAQPDTSAHVTVSLPADAELWFDGTKTTSTGSLRQYQSPPLTPGRRHTYQVRARWNENGQEITQTQQVEVRAGAQVDVHFPVQPTKAPTAPSR